MQVPSVSCRDNKSRTCVTFVGRNKQDRYTNTPPHGNKQYISVLLENRPVQPSPRFAYRQLLSTSSARLPTPC